MKYADAIVPGKIATGCPREICNVLSACLVGWLVACLVGLRERWNSLLMHHEQLIDKPSDHLRETAESLWLQKFSNFVSLQGHNTFFAIHSTKEMLTQPYILILFVLRRWERFVISPLNPLVAMATTETPVTNSRRSTSCAT